MKKYTCLFATLVALFLSAYTFSANAQQPQSAQRDQSRTHQPATANPQQQDRTQDRSQVRDETRATSSQQTRQTDRQAADGKSRKGKGRPRTEQG